MVCSLVLTVSKSDSTSLPLPLWFQPLRADKGGSKRKQNKRDYYVLKHIKICFYTLTWLNLNLNKVHP